MNKHLSPLDAFKTMACFLEKYYDQTQSDDVGSLLGDLQLLADGGTSDPAAWHDWLDCVHKVTSQPPKKEDI